MKLKLIKVEDEWYNLLKSDGELIASDDEDFQHNYKVSKLSTKNCKAIEREYDLDELAEREATMHTSRSTQNWETLKWGVKIGFQKALELMGDKKFSEGDMRKAYQKGEEDSYTQGGLTKQKEDSYIQSLQQKEWDVEIEMEKVKDETKIVGAIKGVKGSGNKITTYKSVPKLDENGCLILKRK